MLCCFMEKSRDIKRVKFCYVIAENLRVLDMIIFVWFYLTVVALKKGVK